LFHHDVRRDFINPAKKYIWEFESRGLLTRIYDSTIVSVFRVADAFRRPAVSAYTGSRQRTINVVKLNPAKYVVQIPASTEDVVLVLRESYSREWRLYRLPEDSKVADYVSGQSSWWDTLFLPKLPQEARPFFSGFGNVWKVRREDLCATVSCAKVVHVKDTICLVVEYQHQRYVFLLLTATLLVAFGGICYLLWITFGAPKIRPLQEVHLDRHS
jgi:hypothetical protein